MSSTKRRFQAFLDFVDWCHRRGYPFTDTSEETERDREDSMHIERAQFRYGGYLYELAMGWHIEFDLGKVRYRSLYVELAANFQYIRTDYALTDDDVSYDNRSEDHHLRSCVVDWVDRIEDGYKMRAEVGHPLDLDTVEASWKYEDIDELVEWLSLEVERITAELDAEVAWSTEQSKS